MPELSSLVAWSIWGGMQDFLEIMPTDGPGEVSKPTVTGVAQVVSSSTLKIARNPAFAFPLEFSSGDS